MGDPRALGYAFSSSLCEWHQRGAAMQQVAEWLQKLGLGQYAQRFAENDISFVILPDLTDQDLEKIGVASLGHRRLLLRAIANLDIASPATAPIPAAPLPIAPNTTTAEAPLHTVPVPPAGERRHVTVMFCDLVGSTGISAGLDAEDWRDLVGAYLDAASAAVAEMGGHIAKKLGDGVMVLFGYPVAQENDAERAARGALSIQRSLAEINRKNADSGKPALNARIGIETGPVVVDASGEIYGDAPNTAARVQALAEPGTVVVTAQVQRQIAGLFVAEERGSHQLKGVPEPVMLFRLVRASGGGRRAGQRHLTVLVGRDEEIAMLMRRWERTRQGDGQLVLIVGEPGLGKSRLIEELHIRLRNTPHTWTEWSCSQLLQNTPLHPITEWGRQRFGGRETAVEQQLADLENTLALIKIDPAENVPFLAPLLDLPLANERLPELAPEEFRRRQLAAITNWVVAGARTQPIVLAIEDVHWADPTTLDFIRGIVERGALVPLLLLITARPEFRPAWAIRSHHATISLAPLDRSQVREMVAELSARHALPKQIVDGVTERTGGVPLFIEEVTRLLLERGEQGGIQAIPPTLQQSLMARLDRLGPAREVAQIGAVIGRVFSYALVRAVAAMDDAALQTMLDRLAEADILLVQGLPPQSEYRFKHALIQDAAYENLLKSRRQILHRRLGEVLRDQFAASAAAEPELLAHHFTQAGLPEAAIEWWSKAGDQALRRSAYVETIGHLTKAIGLAESLPPTPNLRREQIKLQVALLTPLIHVHGYAAPESKTAAERARLLIEQAEALGEPPHDPLLWFSVLYSFWVSNYVAFDGPAMRELATQFLALAQKKGETVPLMIGHRLMGMSLMHTSATTEGLAHLDRVITLYDPGKHRALAMQFGQDVRVATLSYRSLVLWMLGYPTRAIADVEQAVKDAREIGQAATLMYALNVTSLTLILCGNYATAKRQSDEVVVLADEKGTLFWKAYAMMSQGSISTLAGEASDAIPRITTGLSAWRSNGTTLWTTWWLSCLAVAHAKLGHFVDAWHSMHEAMTRTETAETLWQAEINRTAGEITLKSPDPDAMKAETYFERALGVARQQQAKSWELRASMSLARLWRDQGKVQQARELLAPVYGWFTEGFDTRDLKEAKALLEELAT
jgi:class 3 adenylate cyclase/predicted ATPase